jgi:hypothetical protein
VRFVGVAATPDGTIYAVDGLGSRLFRLRPGARTFEVVMPLAVEGDAAVTAADDRLLYVGGRTSLSRVDVSARTAAPVKSKDDLGGFASLSWRAGALVGVEQVAGQFLVVDVKLDAAGLHAQPRRVLATSAASTTGVLAADSFYYLSDTGTIRRLPLR